MTQTDPNANVEQKKTYGVEELQVVGEQLLTKVKELIHEGNVRRIIIKQEGNVILEIPLAFGVAGVILAPTLAAIGVVGALIAQCSIEVVRATDVPRSERPHTPTDEVPPYNGPSNPNIP